MTTIEDMQALTSALANALDAAVAERPGSNSLEVCGAPGAVAGVVVALALPCASAEVDELHLDTLARAYRTALLDMLMRDREAKAAGLQ